MCMCNFLRGLDERGRLMRRNIMRYVLLSYVITLRRISFRVRKRFPTLDHIVDAGLMREDEQKIMEMLNDKCTVSNWWMPLVWATNIVETARHEQRLNNDPGMQTILGKRHNRNKTWVPRMIHSARLIVPPVVITWKLNCFERLWKKVWTSLANLRWPTRPQPIGSHYFHAWRPLYRVFYVSVVACFCFSDGQTYGRTDVRTYGHHVWK